MACARRGEHRDGIPPGGEAASPIHPRSDLGAYPRPRPVPATVEDDGHAPRVRPVADEALQIAQAHGARVGSAHVRGAKEDAPPLLPVARVALADNCKAPRTTVRNDKTAAIKVSKIQYFDTCDNKWRTEDVTAVEIPAGGLHTYTDDLEYVGNCAISKFKLYRAVRQTTGNAYGSYEWGGELVPDQGSGQRCVTGATYTIAAVARQKCRPPCQCREREVRMCPSCVNHRAAQNIEVRRESATNQRRARGRP